MTEGQDIPDSVWDYQISPMLHSPGVLGYAFIEGHAPKPDSWFERLFNQGQQGHPDVDSWHFLTQDNPHVDWESILREADEMPEEAFRQEYFAETPTEVGYAFNKESIDNCVGGTLESPKEGISYVMGVDLGKQIDPTVIIIMRKSQRRVVGYERLLKTDWTIQVDTITRVAREWNNASVVLDSTGVGDPIFDYLRKNGVQAKAINFTKTKVELFDKLVAATEQENIKFPNIPTLIREMKAMRRYAKDKQGRDLKYHRLVAPVGRHDDFPCALALAYHGCRYGEVLPGIKPRYLGSRR